jgi:phosphate transport system substrate-binding protein
VYRRDDLSGTTDTFKNLVGVGVTINGVALPSFGSCVTVVPTTEAIADHTSSEDLAIGYAGLSGGVAGNKALPVALTTTSAPVAPNQSTIRDFSYPLARRLYVMNVSGAQIPTDVEQALLDAMLDRAFLDPILEANEFITCPSLADGGCP